jgi:hypothetical protein
MATFSFYNHTTKLLFEESLQSETLKLQLLSSSAVFDATDTTLAEVNNSGAYEVYGNGWAQGGVTLGSVTVATASTNGVSFDAANVSQLITGGDLGPISAYVVSATTLSNSPPLFYITLSSPITILENESAVINWDTLGIIVGSVV